MEWILYALGILAAVCILAAALVITLLVYFKMCADHPAHKLRVEVGLVLFVALLSLAVRVAVCIIAAPEASFSGGVNNLFTNIFYTVAGLTFNGDFAQAGNGLLASLYYGVVVYASLVFLTAVTAGLSYEIYSKILLWGARNFPAKNTYYVFTSITEDSLVLANSIKRKHRENKKNMGRCTIIFFEKGEESFSRKNPLHRALMESGFYFLSDARRNDKGDAVCLMKKLKLHPWILKKHSESERINGIFHVFAMDYGGDHEYEGGNAATVFEDLKATVNAYFKKKKGEIYGELPASVKYHLLTGGEINFESYERKKSAVLDECECFKGGSGEYLQAAERELKTRFEELIGELKKTDDINEINDVKLEISEIYDADGKIKEDIKKEYAEDIYDGKKVKIGLKLPVHVFNEATLSSYELVCERKNSLDKLGTEAFENASKPDGGAYRIAVIGFGKTGQYAMEELYIHSARLIETGNGGYKPVQFIADVYDARIDEKSGLFAYNHPLFRCINDEDCAQSRGEGSNVEQITEAAEKVSGKAFDILYAECEAKTGRNSGDAKQFVDTNMGFPIVYMHKEQCFKYPFIDKKSAESAIETAKRNDVRDFVVALGNDESNIAMANVLIDSFRRSLLKDYLDGKGDGDGRVTIYVNLLEKRSRVLLNWNWEKDGGENKRLCVIPFGYREEMYSYDNLVEDYNERIYNYGYSLLSGILENKTDAAAKYEEFKRNLTDNPDVYRTDETVTEKWTEVPQFLRLSNKSAHAFSINYYKYVQKLGRNLNPYGADKEDDAKWIYLERLEHERWDRFFIAHGWVYAPYNKFDNFNGVSKAKKKRIKDREKQARRGVRQHNCICPFDEMLDGYTILYDKGNVELGFIERIVYSK